MIGTTLNKRYEIDAEIGRGGMGVVYLAQDTLLRREVAIKVMSATKIGTAGRAHLLQEARATAGLGHPNIVAIHDVGEAQLAGREEPTSYIIMEYVEGQSLQAIRPDTMDQAVEIVQQVCEALEQAHQNGIIHGDLKPENIVVTPSGRVKLMDFGLARVAGQTEPNTEGTVTGTLNYMAPEVILGDPGSPQSDFYALGVIFYLLLTGRAPFEGDNVTAVLTQQLHGAAVPPSTFDAAIPPALDTLILELLNRRPEERPAAAVDILRSLDSWNRPRPGPPLKTGSELGQIDRLARGRLVGRQHELARIADLWRTASSGEGQVLFVSGEPGVGKTRLVRELISLAQLSGGIVLASECNREGAVPYAPFAQIIRPLLQNGYGAQLSETVLANLLTMAPDLRAHFPRVLHSDPMEPEAEQSRLFEGVLTLWRQLAQDGPLLTFIDDVHWADGGTLSLLRHLAHQSRDQPLLLVGTYREMELHQSRSFQELLVDLYRDRTVTRVKLSRLTAEQTHELLKALFSTEVPAPFAHEIYHETEGNPFFVEEVCKGLVERGLIVFSDGQWRRVADKEMEIPQGIQVAIQSRLTALSPQEHEILRLAALLGREFRFQTLLAVCRLAAGLEEDSLIDALDHAERIQIVSEVAPTVLSHAPSRRHSHANPSFAFTHGLIQSALLADLSTLKRQRLQRKVALALEQAFPESLDELLPLLGRYFAEAGEAEKAVTYLLRSGDVARRLHVYDEAIEAYEQALLFLREGNELDRAARTLMNLGLIYHNSFQFERSRLAYEEGFALWQQVVKAAPEAGEAAVFDGGHLQLHVHSPRTLDPASSADGVSEFYIHQLFSGLVELSPDGEILPDAAESWEVLEDGRRYVFYLRRNACWSDGVRLTASDFAFAWKRALDPARGTGPASSLHDIRGARPYNAGEVNVPDEIAVHALDEGTLMVELEGATGYFLQLLTYGVAMPVPQHAVQAYGDSWLDAGRIVTNGPFRLSSWLPGRQLELVRDEGYNGQSSGNLDRVTVFADPQAPSLDMYQRDELDVLNLDALSLQEADRVRHHHPNEYVTIPSAQTTYLAFDTTRRPFDDQRVRQAFALALDKSRLANIAYRGRSFAASGGFVPPGIPGHVANLAFDYDPERARQLMVEAGYPGGRAFPAVDFLVIRRPDTLEYNAEMLSFWQRHLGVNVTLQELFFAEFLERLEEDPPHFWKSGWAADYPDPDNFLRVCHARQTGGWVNQRYERLVEQARQIPDPDRRLAMYREAEEILSEEAPLAPLLYAREHLLVKPRVRRYPIGLVGGVALKNVLIEQGQPRQ